MPFIVTKWIPSGTHEGSPDRKLPYCYLVESYWDKKEKKSKQKVLMYLGPASLKPPKQMTLKQAEKWKKKHFKEPSSEEKRFAKKYGMKARKYLDPKKAANITTSQKRRARILPKQAERAKKLTKEDLYKIAQQYGIKGRSTMNRDQLLAVTRPFREAHTAKPVKVKTLEELSFGELRVIMPKFGLSSGGMTKTQMQKNLRSRMKKMRIDESKTDLFWNLPTGGVSTITFQEKGFNVTIIDKDAQPMRKVKRKRMGEGIYNIEQETYLGEDEHVTALISHAKPPNTKSKRKKRKKK